MIENVDIVERYKEGVDAYWSGQAPAGWNHAADQEHGQNWFTEDD